MPNGAGLDAGVPATGMQQACNRHDDNSLDCKGLIRFMPVTPVMPVAKTTLGSAKSIVAGGGLNGFRLPVAAAVDPGWEVGEIC
jgi:hypothetical protein